MGDFETALMFYHRGNKLRPELQDFRLGIQKAQEAIENSVGSKLIKKKLNPTNPLLSLIPLQAGVTAKSCLIVSSKMRLIQLLVFTSGCYMSV